MPLNSVTHNCEVHDEQTSLWWIYL
jgi:hypothetical protein